MCHLLKGRKPEQCSGGGVSGRGTASFAAEISISAFWQRFKRAPKLTEQLK